MLVYSKCVYSCKLPRIYTFELPRILANSQAPPVVLKGAMKKPSEDGVKKEKKAIHWADENGGLLREVRTIEVAKIKRSTAHYSSTRELSKRERLAEKETHLSKAEDAMQKNTEWRT